MLKDYEALLKTELEALDSGVWGTIGPHSRAAAAALAEAAGKRYGLLCCSADAACEAALRGIGAAWERMVCIPAYSSPVLTAAALRTGARVRYIPCKPDGTLDPVKLAIVLMMRPPVCVLADAEAVTEAVTANCRGAKVPLAVYTGGALTGPDADVLVGSTGAGSAVNAGSGGYLVTDSEALWAHAFAAHNCGRAPGQGSTITFDDALGGDLRVSEFVSIAVEQILKEGSLDTPAPEERVWMELP